MDEPQVSQAPLRYKRRGCVCFSVNKNFRPLFSPSRLMAHPSVEGAVQRTASLVGASSNAKSSIERRANGRASKDDHSQTKKPSRTRFLTSGFSKVLVVSAVFAYFSWKSGPSHTKNSNALPDSYVLCSRNGPAIYTVDDQNRKVSCLAINESRIFDTGDLGNSYRLPPPSSKASLTKF